MTYQQTPPSAYQHQPPAPPARRTSPVLWVALALGVLAVAGVGWLFLRPQPEPAAATSPQIEAMKSAIAAQAALPKCSEIFVPGQTINFKQPSSGCLTPSGGVQYLGFFTCSDGRLLFSVDADSGAPTGWGFGGEKFRATKGEIAADPKYGKAYDACNG